MDFELTAEQQQLEKDAFKYIQTKEPPELER